MEDSLIISFITAICYWAPCLRWGVGSEGQWMGKWSKGESWLVKARRDNTNEDGWLRQAHLIHLIGTLLDEYLYCRQSGGQRSGNFRHTHRSHSLSHVPQANTTEAGKQIASPFHKTIQQNHILQVLPGIFALCDTGSCIYVLDKSCNGLPNNISMTACLLGHESRMDQGWQTHKNMSTPLIMKIGRQVRYFELFTQWAECNRDCFTGASCCLSSWLWQVAQLDAPSVRTDKDKLATQQRIIRQIYITFTSPDGQDCRLKAQSGPMAGSITDPFLSTSKLVWASLIVSNTDIHSLTHAQILNKFCSVSVIFRRCYFAPQ